MDNTKQLDLGLSNGGTRTLLDRLGTERFRLGDDWMWDYENDHISALIADRAQYMIKEIRFKPPANTEDRTGQEELDACVLDDIMLMAVADGIRRAKVLRGKYNDGWLSRLAAIFTEDRY